MEAIEKRLVAYPSLCGELNCHRSIELYVDCFPDFTHAPLPNQAYQRVALGNDALRFKGRIRLSEHKSSQMVVGNPEPAKAEASAERSTREWWHGRMAGTPAREDGSAVKKGC
jgi:hypothetical protein